MKNRFKRASSFKNGIKLGLPIGIGYFASSISIGIMAVKSGLSFSGAVLSSVLLNASAGQYALYTLIGSGGTFPEIIAMQIMSNIRYLLMSTSFSQKLEPGMPAWKKAVIGFGLTDEMYGVSMVRTKPVSLSFYVGLMTVIMPMWWLGTAVGCMAGNFLPEIIAVSLGMGLYGMFIAIIIPPCKRSGPILAGVVSAMAFSSILRWVPFVSGISPGMKLIIVTIIVTGVLALIFPVGGKDDSLKGSDRDDA